MDERHQPRLVGVPGGERLVEAVAQRAPELLGDGARREAGAVELAGLGQEPGEVAGHEGVGELHEALARR